MIRTKSKRILAVLTVIFLFSVALFCRLASILDLHTPYDMGLIRSVIYIILFSVWGIYIFQRIIQAQVRFYLTSIAALMVFWITIRTIKYYFINSPLIIRILWYLYYFPILFIPLLTLLVAMSLGKPEGYRLPKWTTLLFIPALTLLLFVLTNDFHQLAFSFPDDALVYSDKNHVYELIYYAVWVWAIICTLAAGVNILINCRIPGGRKLILMPLAPLIAIIIYGISYVSQFWITITYFPDFTIISCLLIAISFECFLRCGLIRSNSHYNELFQIAGVRAEILDSNYNTFLSSTDAKPYSKEIMIQAEASPVLLDGGIRLSGTRIKGGHVMWTEDVSELSEVLNKLAGARNELKEETALLRENYNTKRRIRHLEEQNRLYDEIHYQTAKQITLLGDLLNRFEKEKDDDAKRRLLQKMIVVGVYIKRRSNFVFIGEQNRVLDERELALCFEETLNNLELSGVECGCYINLSGTVWLSTATAVYDFYEEVMETSYDSLRSMLIRIFRTDNDTVIAIDVRSGVALSEYEDKKMFFRCDDDGVISFSLHIPQGGTPQ